MATPCPPSPSSSPHCGAETQQEGGQVSEKTKNVDENCTKKTVCERLEADAMHTDENKKRRKLTPAENRTRQRFPERLMTSPTRRASPSSFRTASRRSRRPRSAQTTISEDRLERRWQQTKTSPTVPTVPAWVQQRPFDTKQYIAARRERPTTLAYGTGGGP